MFEDMRKEMEKDMDSKFSFDEIRLQIEKAISGHYYAEASIKYLLTSKEMRKYNEMVDKKWEKYF
jgi:hypothetical protein